MPDLVPITVTEGNDEIIEVTLTAVDPAEDLMAVTTVEFRLKDSNCDPDTAALLLSSTVPAQVTVLTHTSDQITANVFLPALTGSYPRVYRVDGKNAAGKRRTSTFGPVTVNNV